MRYRGRLSSNCKADITYTNIGVSGNTPFEFDDVDIAHELRTTAQYRLNRNWALLLDLRYDLAQRRLRDNGIGLLRTLDCLAYGAVFDKARSELSLQFRLGTF